MKVKAFLEQAKLNWNKLYFCPDGGESLSFPFVMAPEDFINFAKADFFNSDKKGLVNALSNAKRAVDCAADGFLVAIGLSPDRLDKQLAKEGLRYLTIGPTEGPLKFRLLQALGIATPGVISKMRRLRNLLEHDYKLPRKKEVSDAIGIAELFVQACRGKMRYPMTEFEIGSGVIKHQDQDRLEKRVSFEFNFMDTPKFKLVFWHHSALEQDEVKPASLTVSLGEPDFLPLLKLTWKADWAADMEEPLRIFFQDVGVRLTKRLHVEEADSF